MVIIGAGLAGIAAKNYFSAGNPITIDSRAESEGWSHKALMRIRDPALGNLIKCPLRKINAYKFIYYQNKIYDTYQPNLSNMYSLKVSEGISERSIDKLGWEERYLIEGDLDEKGIQFNKKVISIKDREIFCLDGSSYKYDKAISTIPLPVLAKACNINVKDIDFKSKSFSITVRIIPLKVDCAVNQTAYFPGNNWGIYRATLQEDKIIIEELGDNYGIEINTYALEMIAKSFGITQSILNLEKTEIYVQENGKISPINNEYRKFLILELTEYFGIYSLGRYATWRNITSEDIIPDLNKISQLMEMGEYERKYYGKISNGGEK